MSNVIFLVSCLLANVKCIFWFHKCNLIKYGKSTTSYGCLGETSITGHTPFISFKHVCTLSPSIKEVAASTMEVDNEITSKQCSQATKEVLIPNMSSPTKVFAPLRKYLSLNLFLQSKALAILPQ